MLLASCVLAGKKVSPQQWCDTENGKHILRYLFGGKRLCLTAAIYQIVLVIGSRRHIFKEFLLGLEVDVGSR